MSLPAELRLLCHQLSSTPTDRLPRMTPTLVRNVIHCQACLTSAGNTNPKPDASESSVLVHKLYTQVSAFLYGKTAEGRFTAVVLIKTIVAVGGWEVLRGVESWVRGLLLVLGKNDPVQTKSLCILSLTSIYFQTYQYQSLVREITTPTLPNFVTSCLSLISPKLSNTAQEVSSSLGESILNSFCVLIPRHRSIFRPYSNQIKVLIRPHLAPTLSDGKITALSMSRVARQVTILLYQTSPKNTNGEEWGSGIRALIKRIHGTADQVYRAVVEDWESTTGYISTKIDINKEVQGAVESEDDLPSWKGIGSGIQRLEGQLQFLKEHFMNKTATAVNVPLDLIVDLLTRLMSVVRPSNSKGASDYGDVRIHPAIERHERDGLWAGLDGVHTASMEVYLTLIDRLYHNFTSLAEPTLIQVCWVFSSHTHDETFRCVAYHLVAKTLLLCGSSLEKSTVALLAPLITTCCKEFSIPEDRDLSRSHDAQGNPSRKGPSANADTFLSITTTSENIVINSSSEVLTAAGELLPLFLSHLPQQYLEGYLRSKIDQIAILTHNKAAMLSSVLNPYLMKNGAVFPSILPHLCRDFSNDHAVEALLRPRFPLLRQNQAIQDGPTWNEQTLQDDEEPLQKVDDLMEDVAIGSEMPEETAKCQIEMTDEQAPTGHQAIGKIGTRGSHDPWDGASYTEDATIAPAIPQANFIVPPSVSEEPSHTVLEQNLPMPKEEDEDEDSDESVHLNMDLSDSEAESVS